MSTPLAEVAGSPQNPALVFLHGVGGDGHSFAPQLTSFSNEYHCLAWHMPGYANSDLITPYDWDGLANALLRLLDYHGIATATLVGHSIGGMVAQHLVGLAPSRVSQLVLSATSPAFGKRDGDFQQQFLAARLGPLDQGHTLASLAPGIVDELLGTNPVANAHARAVDAMSQVPEASYRAAMTAITEFDARATLAQIDCPTLLIAGECDSNAPAAMMARMAEKIPGSQYACIDGAGHLSYMEQPAAFNAILDRFLQPQAEPYPERSQS